MDRPAPSWFDRLIAPRVLLLGAAVSFLGSCLAGFVVSRQNHFAQFDRFHFYIAPETLYYPTACQVRELARSRLDRDKVAVIIGGSSVLHGTCQPPGHVWAERLQALLGDRYQVLNLALRCGRPTELGAIAAEFLAPEYPKLILITDERPGGMHPDPDGLFYKYFYWDAYHKGLLMPHKPRDERLGEVIAEVEVIERKVGKKLARTAWMLADAQREMRRGTALDASLYFSDLWNTLAYTQFHTIWTPLTGEAYTKPRSHWKDPDVGPQSMATRYSHENDIVMQRLHAYLPGKCVKDAAGGWVEDPASGVWKALDRAATVSFPEPTRARTLVVVTWFSPYYIHQLSADEQECFAALSRCSVAHFEKLGFGAMTIGGDYTYEDYGDFQHLTETGGAKLADVVAPKVRAMARQLGYVQGEDR
jgi:hypothetical protein